MSRPDNWESHWPSDDDLLGRAVVHACGHMPPKYRSGRVQHYFSCGSTLANVLVERYVDENGDMKR